MTQPWRKSRVPRTHLRRRTVLSLVFLTAGLLGGLAPLPGESRQLVVVAGTELQQALLALKPGFEQRYPGVRLVLYFRGSQALANDYLEDRYRDVKPTILIPANGEILTKLAEDWRAREQSDPFDGPPQPIARTFLVGIAWPQRGRVLFPQGRFDWGRVAQALRAGQWSVLGGPAQWGSFDFRMTDPLRSNSGQLTLSLWAGYVLGAPVTSTNLDAAPVQDLFRLIKRSVYQPPDSTDTLLEVFIAQGENEGDVAVVYESIALSRWSQAQRSRSQGYQVYYFSPTIETVSTAAIVRRYVSPGLARTAQQFLDYLRGVEAQQVLVQKGFRPVIDLDVTTVAGSPWQQGIPGVEVKPQVQALPSPATAVLQEIQKQWQRTPTG